MFSDQVPNGHSLEELKSHENFGNAARDEEFEVVIERDFSEVLSLPISARKNFFSNHNLENELPDVKEDLRKQLSSQVPSEQP